MRIGWVTDPHLNFVKLQDRANFYHQISEERLDALLLGGDIGEADTVSFFLTEMEATLALPIYFVLGNHDFYRGSIRQVRSVVSAQAAGSKWLHWLPTSGVVSLGPKTALVGHDAWADGRVGDFFGSQVLLNDYVLIEELRTPDKQHRFAKLNELGDEAADYLEGRAREALEWAHNVVVLTHVPPFREACWHEGQISDGEYLPHFACKAVGDRLAGLMREHPQQRMVVLCGHTHSSGKAQILDNLLVLTGGALYGKPALQQMLDPV